jgi:hypothetical protein
LTTQAATHAPAPTAAGLGWALALAALAFAFQLPIFDRWFSFMDEGHMLLYADLIAQGGELYRDATVYPLPGAFYLLALLFRVFEPSNLLARWVVVVEFSAFAALGFLLLRRLLPLAWALGGVLWLLVYKVWTFPHWHMYSYSTTALLLQLAALLVLLGALEGGSRARLALSGLLFGLGVLVKQDYGAAALLTLLSTLALFCAATPRGERRAFPALLACWVAPALCVGAATGLYFWQRGLLGDLLQFTVFNHFTGISSYPYSTFPPLFPLFEQDPTLRGRAASAFVPGILLTSDWQRFAASALYRESAVVDTALKLFYYLPWLVVGAGALRLARLRGELRDPARRRRALAEWALWATGASYLLIVSLNRPQDYVHLAVLYWPILFLALVHAHALLRGRRALAWLLAALLALPAGGALAYTGVLWWRIRSEHTAPIPSPRAGIYVRPAQAELFGQLIAYVQQNSEPDEPVAMMPYFPILAFYAERRGPHRSSYIVWPFPETPDRDRRVIEAMEASRTDLVIWNFTQFTVFNPVSEYAPELFAYLVENFEVERVFGTEVWGYKLAGLRRRPEPSAGAALLSAATPLEVTLRGSWTPPRPVEPDERARFAELAPWPFRAALALRPSRGGRTVVSLPLAVPPGARLRTAVAVHPQNWYHADPAWSEFEIAVVDGDEREALYRRRLRPTPDLADRGWFELDLPLASWGGRRVELEFSASTNKPSGENLLQAGFALPRIVAAAPEPR